MTLCQTETVIPAAMTLADVPAQSWGTGAVAAAEQDTAVPAEVWIAPVAMRLPHPDHLLLAAAPAVQAMGLVDAKAASLVTGAGNQAAAVLAKCLAAAVPAENSELVVADLMPGAEDLFPAVPAKCLVLSDWADGRVTADPDLPLAAAVPAKCLAHPVVPDTVAATLPLAAVPAQNQAAVAANCLLAQSLATAAWN